MFSLPFFCLKGNNLHKKSIILESNPECTKGLFFKWVGFLLFKTFERAYIYSARFENIWKLQHYMQSICTLSVPHTNFTQEKIIIYIFFFKLLCNGSNSFLVYIFTKRIISIFYRFLLSLKLCTCTLSVEY